MPDLERREYSAKTDKPGLILTVLWVLCNPSQVPDNPGTNGWMV
jgi:hypothetical protein